MKNAEKKIPHKNLKGLSNNLPEQTLYCLHCTAQALSWLHTGRQQRVCNPIICARYHASTPQSGFICFLTQKTHQSHSTGQGEKKKKYKIKKTGNYKVHQKLQDLRVCVFFYKLCNSLQTLLKQGERHSQSRPQLAGGNVSPKNLFLSHGTGWACS